MKRWQYISKASSVLKIISVILFTVFFAFAASYIYKIHGAVSPLLLYRWAFLLLAYTFLLLNVFINYKVLYQYVFRHRYMISLVLFCCFVLAKLNFSSIAMYDYYVQPGSGSEFITPVFGGPLSIRSDEWAINTPRSLTYQFCVGQKYNDIIMASQTLNLKTSGVALSLSMITKPFNMGFLFLGAEYAVSFYWGSLLIVGLLAGIEFFLVITKNNKLLSFMGSVAIIFSSFTVWWSGNEIVIYAMAAVAGIYRFLSTESRKIRIICGILIAAFGSAFVGVMYPAWQVPAGYTFLAVIIWSFVVNWGNIKKFKAIDWIIFAVTVVAAIVVIVAYLIENMEYTKAVMDTVYPGSRRVYGGYTLDKMFTYPATLLFPFKAGEFTFSEYGMYFSLYPMPTLVAIFILFKLKKKDLLNILLLTVSAVFTVYCTFGVPTWFGDISLLSYSFSTRVLTYVDFIQILLLTRSMAIMDEQNIYIPKRFIIPSAAILSVFTVYLCDKKFTYQNFMSFRYMIVIAVMLIALMVCFVGRVSRKLRDIAIVFFIVVHCAVSAFVPPIQKGLDPIYSKPVAQKAMEIAEEDPDARWIAVDQWIEANFYAACGAKVINSNNYIPNFELWETLDPEGKYNDVYNRYANFIISLTDEESVPILNQADLITLKLNYGQLDDIGARYLVTKYVLDIPEKYNIGVEQLYAENGTYIYSLEYK